MPAQKEKYFPRIMLTYDIRRGAPLALWRALLANAGIAAVILHDSAPAADEAGFQKAAEPLVLLIQHHEIPVIIAETGSICGRLKADGVHIEEAAAHGSTAETIETLAVLRDKYKDARILGYGNPHSRHTALQAGENAPDYMFFGKLGKDKNPQPHSRNLSLGAWWAELVNIDCIIQAGNSLDYLADLAATKAEFIALENMIFSAEEPPQALRQAETILRNAKNAVVRQ